MKSHTAFVDHNGRFSLSERATILRLCISSPGYVESEYELSQPRENPKEWVEIRTFSLRKALSPERPDALDKSGAQELLVTLTNSTPVFVDLLANRIYNGAAKDRSIGILLNAGILGVNFGPSAGGRILDWPDGMTTRSWLNNNKWVQTNGLASELNIRLRGSEHIGVIAVGGAFFVRSRDYFARVYVHIISQDEVRLIYDLSEDQCFVR